MIAAVGTDGVRPVVWGVGSTLAKARAEAECWLSEAGDGEMVQADLDSLDYHKISKKQAQVVLDGDVSWPITA